MEFFTGGGCGGHCANAAGPAATNAARPATSKAASVTTDMRSIRPPQGIRPVRVVAKLSHNFPAGVSARVVAENLFWTLRPICYMRARHVECAYTAFAATRKTKMACRAVASGGCPPSPKYGLRRGSLRALRLRSVVGGDGLEPPTFCV